MISYGAIHEAGHAVVAAHLRVPFTHVTIKGTGELGGYVRCKQMTMHAASFNARTGEAHWKSAGEIEKEKRRQVENNAIMILAARCAVDAFFKPAVTARLEDSYGFDEKNLASLASMLAVPCFDQWRTELLDSARQIVYMPHVKHAILLVSLDLEAAHQKKKGISSKHVREVLREELAQARAC